MGQVLHKCAKTTHAIRKEIQNSKESIGTLAKRYNINPKTVVRWRKRTSVEDLSCRPKKLRTTMTPEQEAIVVAFRTTTGYSLDDVLIALKEEIPGLNRSNLHRCLQRHGISRKPVEEDKEPKKKFKKYPIGFVHVDISEIQLKEEKIYLFVGIDRTSKLAYAESYSKATIENAANFLEKLREVFPYKIDKILTDNGIQFSYKALRGEASKEHAFTSLCKKYGIEHRQTQPYHPWTNGQVERMNRSIKENTVKVYHYTKKEEAIAHINIYLQAYNFGKRLKVLKYKTPYEYIVDEWAKDPAKFKYKPDLNLMGLYT